MDIMDSYMIAYLEVGKLLKGWFEEELDRKKYY